ncbi:MAG: hypothetical protein LBG87_08035 [Spirochaetaceae bacterium]|jgi:hypothetical protein|nr:hypothetical protein [Spirochaetaceae bacterium]
MKLYMIALLAAFGLCTACQDLFLKHADEASVQAETVLLYSGEWRVGRIAVAGEVDVYRVGVAAGERYWLEWADAESEPGLISGISLEARYEDDPDGELVFDEKNETNIKRFWSYRRGFLRISVNAENPQAFGEYRIRLRQTAQEDLTGEGFLPAPKIEGEHSRLTVLKWTAPAGQSYQQVYRIDSAEPAVKFYYAVIFNFTEDLASREYTFVDYFTEPDHEYIYYINGGGVHNTEFGYWSDTTDTIRTKPIKGRSEAHQRITGKSIAAFDPATGDIAFDPPLPVMTGHPTAAGRGLGDLCLLTAETSWEILLREEAELSALNLYALIARELPGDDGEQLLADMRNGTWEILYYPIYYKTYPSEAEENPDMLELEYYQFNPYNAYELTGDTADLRLD